MSPLRAVGIVAWFAATLSGCIVTSISVWAWQIDGTLPFGAWMLAGAAAMVGASVSLFPQEPEDEVELTDHDVALMRASDSLGNEMDWRSLFD